MRVQALRQKREAIDGAATEDAWTLHVAERSMLAVGNPDAGPQEAAWPGAAPVEGANRLGEENVSSNGKNSHDVAFETRLSQNPMNRASGGSGERALDRVLRKAMAYSRLDDGECPANGRESPGRAN